MFDLKKHERPLVEDFLEKIDFRCYIYRDRDMGAVRTKSGFDFSLAANGKVIYIEAKKNKNWLSDYQEIVAIQNEKAGNPYYVLHFSKEYKDEIGLLFRQKTVLHQGFDAITKRFEFLLSPKSNRT